MKVEKIALGLIGTNTYLVINEDSMLCLVIDPAYCGKTLIDYLNAKKLKIAAILLTHGHFDHCGGAKSLLQGKNIPIYCSSLDSEIAANASKNRWKAHADDCKVTNFVTDGQTIYIAGFSVTVLATHGHTPGSVCYFIDDFLFSGDTLFSGDIGRTDLEGGDHDAIMKSLNRLSKIDGDYKVCPGHEESSTLNYEKENNPYLIEASTMK